VHCCSHEFGYHSVHHQAKRVNCLQAMAPRLQLGTWNWTGMAKDEDEDGYGVRVYGCFGQEGNIGGAPWRARVTN